MVASGSISFIAAFDGVLSLVVRRVLLLQSMACGASGSTSVVIAVDGVWSLVEYRVLLLQSMACGR